MKILDIILQNWRIKKAIKFISKESKVLDIGSFDGSLFKKLGSKLQYGIGIEPLLFSQEKGVNYTLYPGFFPKDMPAEKEFDSITLLAVFEHIPKEIQVEIAERCYNLLKTNGKVIITVPSEKVDIILDILIKLKLADGMEEEQHYGFKPKETVLIFKEPNFKLIHNSTFQFGLNNLFVFEKI